VRKLLYLSVKLKQAVIKPEAAKYRLLLYLVEYLHHMFNMEVDLQSLHILGSMSRDVHSWTHWLRHPAITSAPHLDSIYEGAIS
jgi:hypothetical protein